MTKRELSKEARNALVNVRSSRQGATISKDTVAQVIKELRDAGLIENFGLTRKGTTAREQALEAALEF